MAEFSHRERVPEPAWSGCSVRRRCSAPWSRRATECPAAASAGALACVASLWGLSVEELSAAKLDVADARFPLVACAHAEKAR